MHAHENWSRGFIHFPVVMMRVCDGCGHREFKLDGEEASLWTEDYDSVIARETS